MNSERKPFNWFKADIDKDLNYEYGTAIPCYFHLIKYYLFIVVILCLTMSLYYLYKSYEICNELIDGVSRWDIPS
jgi:hypothetical protein